MKYKYWELEIDGPDKAGKELLCKYLCEMSHYRFSINVRGLMSQLVYTRKFGRGMEYDTSAFSKTKVLVLLTADVEDLMIRCIATNTPSYDFEYDLKLFEQTADKLKPEYIILRYNTSCDTPYEIAKNVIEKINRLEGLE